jgi:hypothetical protein
MVGHVDLAGGFGDGLSVRVLAGDGCAFRGGGVGEIEHDECLAVFGEGSADELVQLVIVDDFYADEVAFVVFRGDVADVEAEEDVVLDVDELR